MMAARLKPLFDRVLVQRVDAAKKIGGVFIPESAQSKLQEGVVVAIGTGARTMKGETIPPVLKVGDKVLLPQYGGDKVEIDKKEYALFSEKDILGVLEGS